MADLCFNADYNPDCGPVVDEEDFDLPLCAKCLAEAWRCIEAGMGPGNPPGDVTRPLAEVLGVAVSAVTWEVTRG